eukprot:460408-Rhodomonas_salina.5
MHGTDASERSWMIDIAAQIALQKKPVPPVQMGVGFRSAISDVKTGCAASGKRTRAGRRHWPHARRSLLLGSCEAVSVLTLCLQMYQRVMTLHSLPEDEKVRGRGASVMSGTHPVDGKLLVRVVTAVLRCSDELSGKPHCPTAHIWDAKVRTEKAYAASRRCMLAANAPTDSCFCEPTPHS